MEFVEFVSDKGRIYIVSDAEEKLYVFDIK